MKNSIFIFILVLSSCTFREKAIFDDLVNGIQSTTDKIIEDEIGAQDAQGNAKNKPSVTILKKRF